ncbi:hypothetical protein BGZ99_009305 [Dissophora globulifera]|uniref:Uncharacterized protein n=1 Tax=Dissophora globulifera TaxID=979702 RepID=A0A9P6UNH1_9FUNG|nr:hypothetical protein BGZ99_009305 [Dissophora globulifera]
MQAIVRNILLGVVGAATHFRHPQVFEEIDYPDYFAEYDGYPLLVVEIKKPGAVDDDLEGDERKLPSMQKLILDRMLDAGVRSPTVVGILVKGSRCEMSLMSLEYEALYVVKTVGVFKLPQNNLQLSLQCPGLSALALVQATEYPAPRIVVVDEVDLAETKAATE